MKSIKLTIRKLGPIRASEIELMPFMLFSGESGLGKSYLAILCHYFFEVMANKKRLNALFDKLNVNYEGISSHFEESGTILNLKKSDLEDWLASDAVDYLRYMLGNASFEADFSVTLPSGIIPDVIDFSYKKVIVELNDKKEEAFNISVPGIRLRVGEIGVNEESPLSFLLRLFLMQHILEDRLFDLRTFVLPPSRGPVLTEQVIPVTGLYSSFNKCISWLKRVPNQPVERNQEFLALMEDVLEGEVSFDGEKFMYYHSESMPLSAAASSIRELAILSMIAERTDLANMVMLFEEPEAHLHPAKQRAMADALSLMNTFGSYVQVTTHSDYLLRRLNELIKLQKIMEQKEEAEYERICESVGINSHFSFEYKRMGAYLLVRNEDGSSRIVRQSLDDGVPFSSFHNAIEKSLSLDQKLTDILDGENS